MMPDQDSTSTLFPIPPVVRRIFDSFPVLTYPATPLPTRCPRPQSVPTLYVFSTPEDAASGRPSFNPSCLKWQAFLRLCGIRYRIVPSNNHASPSGALPFLIPASKPATSVPGSRLSKWAEENGKTPQSCDFGRPEIQAFSTLIDTKVRDAWLYAFYLEPRNFHALAKKHYCSSSVPIVDFFLSRELRNSAHAELIKSRPGGVVNGDEIYADAELAIHALATVLGEGRWFFGAQEPGIFDASVFAYTHLILTLPWESRESALARSVQKHHNLVAHQERIQEICGW